MYVYMRCTVSVCLHAVYHKCMFTWGIPYIAYVWTRRVLSRASQQLQLELGIPPADGLEPPPIGTPRPAKAPSSKETQEGRSGECMATLKAYASSISHELVRP